MLAEILTVACLLMMFWCVRLLLRAKDHFKAVNGIPMGKNENPANVPPEESPAAAGSGGSSAANSPDCVAQCGGQGSSQMLQREGTCSIDSNDGVLIISDVQLNKIMEKKNILTDENKITNFIDIHIQFRDNMYVSSDNQLLSPQVTIDQVNEQKFTISYTLLINIINNFVRHYRDEILPQLNTNYKNIVLPQLNDADSNRGMTQQELILHCFEFGNECGTKDGRCMISSENNSCIPKFGLI